MSSGVPKDFDQPDPSSGQVHKCTYLDQQAGTEELCVLVPTHPPSSHFPMQGFTLPACWVPCCICCPQSLSRSIRAHNLDSSNHCVPPTCTSSQIISMDDTLTSKRPRDAQ